MPERKVKVPFPTPNSPLRDGTDVGVKESTERWSEIILEDGTVLRLKPSVLAAIRIDGEYDPEGNPVYVLRAGQIMSAVSTPDALRRPQPGSKVH